MPVIDRSSAVPVYRQVYEYFRARILDGTLPADTLMPSIRELQRDFGLARESIKHAMAELAADGYVRKIQGKGTFVAPRYDGRRFWGLVVPFYAEFYNQLIVELRHVAEQEGVAIEHACDYDRWQRQLEVVNGFAWRRAEAIIVVPTRDESRTIAQFQRIARRQPLVLFDRSSIASQLPYVIQDYVLGVRIAMEHLIRRGCRRIAYVSDPLWQGDNPIYQTMAESYSQVCASMAQGYERYWDSPYALQAADFEHLDFDGVMCENDEVACLMVGLLREHGIAVPDRAQVIGYNNSDVGRFFTPRISTTSADLPRMCRLVRDIIQRFKRDEPVEFLQYVAIPRVVPGGTTRQAAE
jgi:DNA-binding LacI/PurR family transcriptional regulator